MTTIDTVQTNFTAGEIAPAAWGRGDLRAYANGAAALRNVSIDPLGGVARRAGLRWLDQLTGPARLLTFEFNTEQVYLVVVRDLAAQVYAGGVSLGAPGALVTPWSAAQLSHLSWTQSADTLIVMHPEHPTKKITRTGAATFTIADWLPAAVAATRRPVPHHKFAAAEVTLAASATTGSVTLTASAAHFVAGHVGKRFRLVNKEVEVTAFTSATQVTATVIETLTGTAATKDWSEEAWSSLRGWPVTICFHQGRATIGGSRDLPHWLWLSQTSDLTNFELGTAKDDEAISVQILSDQVNAIRGVAPGRNLQVFTSGAEWMLDGNPLTPSKIQLRRQTRVGSPVDRHVPPVEVDGATLFVPRANDGIYDFIWQDVEQAYSGANAAVLSQHLIDAPVRLTWDAANRWLYCANADGTLAVQASYRAEEVSAWSLLSTDGAVRDVCHAEDATFAVIERSGVFSLQVFDPAFGVDAGLAGTDPAGKTVWTGLGHLAGETVRVLADGADAGQAVVSAGGTVTLALPAKAVQIGRPFEHRVEPLPPSAAGDGKPGARRYRLLRARFRLRDTAAFTVDTGAGYRVVPLRRFGAALLDQPPQPWFGDVEIAGRGWARGGVTPPWAIRHDEPLPFCLLSVAADIERADS